VSARRDDISLGSEDFYFLPLGGSGEIGMNFNLYGHDGRWLIVDLGVTFGSSREPGVDVMMADPAFIEARREEIAGLVLTHAHEDHIGAVPYLWSRLRCPIYATPFTAGLVRRKLAEVALEDEAELREVPLSGAFSVGPFEIELITLTHSIPEPNAVVLRTAAGTVLHTGDWKLDPDPLVGDDYDMSRLRQLADERVLAMVCDSTNALVEGHTGSEGDVLKRLGDIISGLERRVAVACFASNVARLSSIMQVAEATGRRVSLVGRSMHRIVEAAIETGYLTVPEALVSEREIDYLPREEVLLLCTGSQGERRSALWRIANGEHPHVGLEEGDAVIFSSRIIPGNELDIFALQNAMARQGIEVITDEGDFVHVSGHPARDELRQMYQWVRPEVAIPVHGEARHLLAHARLARECQVPGQIVCGNGDLIRLAPGPTQITGRVPTGRLAYDGSRLLPMASPVFRERQKLALNGTALITLVVDDAGRLDGDPELTVKGLLDLEHEEEIFDLLVEAVIEAVERLGRRARRDDEALATAARQGLRRAANRLCGKKPETDVHLVRLE
jgi:ribonuclease J